MERLAVMHAELIDDESSQHASLLSATAVLRVTTAAQDDDNALSHARATAAVTTACNMELDASRARRISLERSLAKVEETWAETLRQMEEDLATEVHNMAHGAAVEKLDAVRASALHFKGDNAMMKKKYGGVLNSIDDCKADVLQSREAAAELKRNVAALERDLSVLRGVIRDKDFVVGERERRIYELKKENQVRITNANRGCLEFSRVWHREASFGYMDASLTCVPPPPPPLLRAESAGTGQVQICT